MESSTKRKKQKGIGLALLLFCFLVSMHLFVNVSNTITVEEMASLSRGYDHRLNRRANRKTFPWLVNLGGLTGRETRFLTKDGRAINLKLPAVDCKDGIRIGAELSFEMVERGS